MDYILALSHEVFKVSSLAFIVFWELVHLTELSDSFEELISRRGLLTLEEGKPEDDGVGILKGGGDVCGQIVVNNIFEIDGVKLVGPWMQNLEALMVHVLLPESFNIFLDEFKVSLISLNWVAQVILVDSLSVVSKERSNGLDAGCALQVLGGKQLVKMLFEGGATSIGADLKHLKDSHEDLFETFEVPVLINNSMNNS